MKIHLMLLSMTAFLTLSAHANMASPMIEELDPSAENIEEVLRENEFLNAAGELFVDQTQQNYVENCYRETCPVFIEVDKSTQRAVIKIDGIMLEDQSGKEKGGQLRVSTGMTGHRTPNFDANPQAKSFRLYDRYSSSKYPGGNWIGPDKKGYGNMPFVVFFKGGYGVHGTPKSNILKLGTKPLSHGCVRIHPLNAKEFNRAVKKNGRRNTWVYIHE